MYLLIPIQLSNDEHTDIFTFHYVSINSRTRQVNDVLWHRFTFHYVSINSSLVTLKVYTFPHLHSTMYLLILVSFLVQSLKKHHLHSTMYLLILFSCHIITTFHYVSINSAHSWLLHPHLRHLHSTMYLLIPARCPAASAAPVFTFHYVSINSYRPNTSISVMYTFTFHYVSINSPPAHLWLKC